MDWWTLCKINKVKFQNQGQKMLKWTKIWKIIWITQKMPKTKRNQRRTQMEESHILADQVKIFLVHPQISQLVYLVDQMQILLTLLQARKDLKKWRDWGICKLKIQIRMFMKKRIHLNIQICRVNITMNHHMDIGNENYNQTCATIY